MFVYQMQVLGNTRSVTVRIQDIICKLQLFSTHSSRMKKVQLSVLVESWLLIAKLR